MSEGAEEFTQVRRCWPLEGHWSWRGRRAGELLGVAAPAVLSSGLPELRGVEDSSVLLVCVMARPECTFQAM